MCKLYSITKIQDAIRQLFGIAKDSTGNIAPLSGAFLTIPHPASSRWQGSRTGD